MTTTHRDAGIYVGPQAADELEAAVTGAGGRVVASPREATGMVWFGGSPQGFRDVVHPGVRWVQLPAAGVESWFAAGAIDTERVFTSAAGCYAPAVAEHTLALMLVGSRRLHELARARTWTRPEPRVLAGATVAIVGCGGIGTALIELLAPLRTTVLAVTRSGREVPGAVLSVAPDRLHEVLTQADHVVVAAPSTSATRFLVGAPELAVMRPGSWLVNIARGSLVDTDALVEALAAGSIGGAALDVTDPEPLPDGHPLWDEPRALITPHSANPGSLQVPALAVRVRRNTESFLSGRQLEGVVDVAAGY